MKKLLTLLLAGAAALTAPAAVVTRTIAYEHAGAKLEGFLAYDDTLTAKAKLPGVLVVHEWWGLNDYARSRAKQLAKLGYVAFALDMYGAGISTLDPKKAGELAGQFYGKPLMAERARAGLDQLLATGLVDGTRVAAIGYCFGGSTVQALAYSGAPLAGIVSFHGGLIPVPADAAAKTKAKILICHGAIDPFVSRADLDAFLQAMNDGKFDYQFISYAGAIHAFTNPRADDVAKQAGLP
ncbi:MAG: dienelactone hydrolase family protein, partial [Verrucomicrobia bacterium]|nr:dienelactone hydrolase family protein [Verrucomicrobiota bacterium]